MFGLNNARNAVLGCTPVYKSTFLSTRLQKLRWPDTALETRLPAQGEEYCGFYRHTTSCTAEAVYSTAVLRWHSEEHVSHDKLPPSDKCCLRATGEKGRDASTLNWDRVTVWIQYSTKIKVMFHHYETTLHLSLESNNTAALLDSIRTWLFSSFDWLAIQQREERQLPSLTKATQSAHQ